MRPSNMQMELINFQCNTDLKEKFKNFELLEFYAQYVDNRSFPEIWDNALFVASLFGSTYCCEQFFSMQRVKSKFRNRITDQHLGNSLRIANTSTEPNIDELVKKKMKP